MKKLFIAVLLLCVASIASAQTKVGVVDMGKCILTSNAGIQAAADLKTFGNDLAAKLKIKEANEEFEKMRKEYIEQEKVLTESAKRAKVEALQVKGQEVEALTRSFTNEAQKKERELMAKIQGELVEIIKTVAKEGKYTIIIDIQAVPYVTDGLDITNQVLNKYNAQYKK